MSRILLLEISGTNIETIEFFGYPGPANGYIIINGDRLTAENIRNYPMGLIWMTRAMGRAADLFYIHPKVIRKKPNDVWLGWYTEHTPFIMYNMELNLVYWVDNDWLLNHRNIQMNDNYAEQWEDACEREGWDLFGREKVD